MKTAFFTAALLLFCLHLSGQDSVVVHLNKNYEKTSPDSAVYIRKAVKKNNRICVTDMRRDGSKILYCEYKSLNPAIEDGKAVFYKNNDSIYATGLFRLGQMIGKWVYFKNGIPDTVNYSFINQCDEDIFKKTAETDTEDKLTQVIRENVLDSLPKFINDNFHMPPRAKMDSIKTFSRYFNFIVDQSGEIICPSVDGATYTDIDRELYRILSLYRYQGEVRKPFRVYSDYSVFEMPESNLPDPEEVYVVVDQMPSFPGGDFELQKFVAMNLRYPGEAKRANIQGTVIVRFCVKSDGSVCKITIPKGVSPALDAEAVRVVRMFPRFKPGMQGGKPVAVWSVFPVKFRLK